MGMVTCGIGSTHLADIGKDGNYIDSTIEKVLDCDLSGGRQGG